MPHRESTSRATQRRRDVRRIVEWMCCSRITRRIAHPWPRMTRLRNRADQNRPAIVEVRSEFRSTLNELKYKTRDEIRTVPTELASMTHMIRERGVRRHRRDWGTWKSYGVVAAAATGLLRGALRFRPLKRAGCAA